MTTAIASSTTASALPLSPSDRRRRAFEEKQRMVLTSLLFPSLERKAMELSTPRFMKEQERNLRDLQTEADIAEEEARKLEEEIKRIEADLADSDSDDSDDSSHYLDRTDSCESDAVSDDATATSESESCGSLDDTREDDVVFEESSDALEAIAEVAEEVAPQPAQAETPRTRSIGFVRDLLRNTRRKRSDTQ